jgi:ATP-dependent RNA helicase DeaD
VESFEAVIVFVRTKNETETLAEKLRARGFSAVAINGDVPQPVRERTVAQLRSGELDVLVATDVAARGLDVQRISHVVNYDIPTDTESYVHRIGRTGRAGREGDAISFVTPRERYLLRHLEKANGVALEQMALPSVEDVNSTRLTRFDDAITEALGAQERVDFFRDVVAHYVREHDVPELDVAAALASVLQGDEPLLLDAEPEPVQRPARDRDPKPGDGFATYRIDVGRKHRVEPRQIVGALANEGGLNRRDFGAITIRSDFSLVELPAQLSGETWGRLQNTRIGGRPIKLRQDAGRPGRPHRTGDGPPAGKQGKKPRHKKDR